MHPEPENTNAEERLSGGNSNEVARSGDSVLRSSGAWTPAVHRLLRHLRAQGIGWVPEPRGFAPDGREIVGFIKGSVPTYPMPGWIWSDAVLTEAARKLRALHDATVGYHDPDAIWQQDTRHPIEVICHNDFAPYNMVFHDNECSGVIDFDMASPGPRIRDIAYLAYRIVPLTAPANPDGIANHDTRTRRLGRLFEAYGQAFERLAVIRTASDILEEFVGHIDAGRPDLASHADLYRNDMAYLETLASD